MKKLRKIVRLLDKGEDIIVFLLCIVLFLTGAYAMYDSYMVYKGANNTDILKLKPGCEDGFGIAKEIQGKMVAWLTLDDTTVDYPVMQGKTNVEYLSKDPFGEYSLSGSIFLDSRNSPDFSDGYSLIYGHHMEGGLMFGELDAFLDKEFFEMHKSGELVVGDDTYKIHIFAVMETEATNELIFAPTEANASSTMGYVKKNSLFFDSSIDVDSGAPIMGMSTCKYPDTVERTVVFGMLGMQ